MGLADFLDRFQAKMRDNLAARADRAGKAGVAAARAVVPVRTGHLRDSITYGYDQSKKTLTLIAEASYAADVARRSPYMRVGAAAMSKIFTGNTNVQFSGVGEKYQPKARLLAGKGTIIGHRQVRKVR